MSVDQFDRASTWEDSANRIYKLRTFFLLLLFMPIGLTNPKHGSEKGV